MIKVTSLLIWLKVHLGSVLESELRQKRRYGAKILKLPKF